MYLLNYTFLIMFYCRMFSSPSSIKLYEQWHCYFPFYPTVPWRHQASFCLYYWPILDTLKHGPWQCIALHSWFLLLTMFQTLQRHDLFRNFKSLYCRTVFHFMKKYTLPVHSSVMNICFFFQIYDIMSTYT